MVKQFMRKRTKRVSCKKRYRVERKIRQHNKKKRRLAKKNPQKKGAPKDPGIPNSLPFKDKILQEAQRRKEMEEELKQKRKEELKQKRKEERSKQLMERRGLSDLTNDVAKRTKEFEEREAAKKEVTVSTLDSRQFKPFYREFHKVVEAADVILEVLDARDPLGSRCPQVEKAVLDAGPNKRLVLVLNKIDLIPTQNLNSWLKYLRNEFPTIPFKASTQAQKDRLSRRRIRHFVKDDMPSLTPCFGAELLMKLLGNYCRSKDIRTSIRVGVVGFPNVGKSSIVNSLKRSRACNVGATPGVTRKMQEVQLDKHIVLLDSPGVVLAQKTKDEAGAALRNAVKVESLNDAIPAVEAVLRRTDAKQLMLYYRIPQFGDTKEFLALLAKRFGRLKKQGIPDVEAAAKNLIKDWTTGKIKYYTLPPENAEQSVHVSAEIVSMMASEFDVESLESLEKEQITNLQNTMPVGMVDAIKIEGCGFTEGTTEGLKLPLEQEVISEQPATASGEEADVDIPMDDVSDQVSDVLGVVDQVKVDLKAKRTRRKTTPSKKTKMAILEGIGMKPQESSIPGNLALNKVNKQALKKLKKRQKRNEKLVDKLSDNLLASFNIQSSNEDYDFQTDFR